MDANVFSDYNLILPYGGNSGKSFWTLEIWAIGLKPHTYESPIGILTTQ